MDKRSPTPFSGGNAIDGTSARYEKSSAESSRSRASTEGVLCAEGFRASRPNKRETTDGPGTEPMTPLGAGGPKSSVPDCGSGAGEDDRDDSFNSLEARGIALVGEGVIAFTSRFPPPDVTRGLSGPFRPHKDHRDLTCSSVSTGASAGASGSPSFDRLIQGASVLPVRSLRRDRRATEMFKREVDGAGFGFESEYTCRSCVTSEGMTGGDVSIFGGTVDKDRSVSKLAQSAHRDHIRRVDLRLVLQSPHSVM